MNDLSEIDGDVHRSHREKLAEQLEKRNRDRQQQISIRHDLNKRNAAEYEDQDYFLANYREQVKSVDNAIASLKPGDRVQLTNAINKIANDLQNLQQYITVSTMFLSSYNLKACQSTLNELTNKLSATKDKLLAKKKFGFRSKVEAKESPLAESTVSAQLPESNSDQHIVWTLQKRRNEEIILCNAEVNDRDVTISSMENCLIRIIGHVGSLQMSHLTNCVILCGPVARSIFADYCMNCKFAFGCQQLRLHSSNNCDLYMHVTCRAIIEDCQHIKVAPYNYSYDGVESDFRQAGLDLTRNNWDQVADFNWLSQDVDSPNWHHIDADKRITCWDDFVADFRQKFL